jgi:hypothetical protein
MTSSISQGPPAPRGTRIYLCHLSAQVDLEDLKLDVSADEFIGS